MERISKTHFKRQNNKNTKQKVVILILLIILTLLVKNYLDNHKSEKAFATNFISQVEDHALKTATAKAEADITKAVLEVRASKSKRFVTEVNNEIEYLLLTEDGDYNISHARNGNSGFFKKTFANSKLSVSFHYSAIFCIKTKDLIIYQDDNKVHIEYDPTNIYVKSIEVSEGYAKSKKSWFGKEYSNQEVVSLLEIAKDEIRSQLEIDDKLKTEASNNLESYFESLGKELDIDGLYINNNMVLERTYNFLTPGTVKYNHSWASLEKVEYIVIHSTGVQNVSALKFYDNLNSCVQKREASAHYYADYENVVETVNPSYQAWHCFSEKPKIPATNQNSVSIEICQYDDADKQEKSIQNTVKFVKEVLQVKYPEAKIVMHREIKATQCPSVLSDERFDELFRKEQ